MSETIQNYEHLSVQSPSAPRGRAGAHAEPALQWGLTDHCCRACYGRLVRRPGETQGAWLYQCTNCGREAAGADASVLCACGTKVRKATPSGRSGSVMMDAGIRCHVNPSPTPEFPSLIVASEVGSAA